MLPHTASLADKCSAYVCEEGTAAFPGFSGATGKAVREVGEVVLSAKQKPVVHYGKQTNGRLREAISYLARPIFI